jgi:hypothetical protein
MNKIDRKGKEFKESNSEESYIEVWEDLVNIKDLILALIFCSVTTLGGYFLAPKSPPKPLLFGISGAIFGFMISSILIKPKRVLLEGNKES